VKLEKTEVKHDNLRPDIEFKKVLSALGNDQ